MTKEEFIAKRAIGRGRGKSKLTWFLATVFVACCVATIYLVGFLCYLPFEKFLTEDKSHIFVREIILTLLSISVAGGILIADYVQSKKYGFICHNCNKRLGSKVEETGCCGHCGAPAFAP
jgi:hypothetical protein